MINTMAHRFSRWAVALATVGVVLASGPLAKAQSADDDSGWEVGADASGGAEASAQASDNARPQAPAHSKAVASAQYKDTDPAALTDFRQPLDPYGSWVQDPTYGLVWVPSTRYVGSDFAPYVTSGHWGLTASGDWIWVSDYPFGWVVFHYGRWVWISGTGWAWIPGRRYANAWVVWRVPDDDYGYIGWAPMPPSWGWYNGVAVTLWFGPPVPYVFCPSYYVFYPHVYRHIVHDRGVIRRVAHHTSRWRGPRGRGPSPHRAHVPAKAVPRHHTPANPRAVAASRPSPYRIHHKTVRSRPDPSRPHRLDKPRTLSGRHVRGSSGSSSHTLGGRAYTGHGAVVPSRSLRTQRPVPVRVPSHTTRHVSPRVPVHTSRPVRRAPSYRSTPTHVYRPSRTYRPSHSYHPSRSSRSWSHSSHSSSSGSSHSYRPAPHRSYSVHHSAPRFHSFTPRTVHSRPAGRGSFHGRRR